MKDAEYWIAHLQLSPHPEGGYFGETYRSADSIPPSGLPVRYNSARATATAIYFLLRAGDASKFHRLRSNEIWLYHVGHPLTMYIISPDGRLETRMLGVDFDKHEHPQILIPHGVWFAARIETEQTPAYTLLSCVVAPGFEYHDFELAARESLLTAYPQHEALIMQLT